MEVKSMPIQIKIGSELVVMKETVFSSGRHGFQGVGKVHLGEDANAVAAQSTKERTQNRITPRLCHSIALYSPLH